MQGHDAIEYAERHGLPLRKYTDPTEGERAVTLDEAREIAREDPSLIYIPDADRIRHVLADAGLSQRGAARELDIDERTMRRYCSGELAVPRVVWLALETVKRNSSE